MDIFLKKVEIIIIFLNWLNSTALRWYMCKCAGYYNKNNRKKVFFLNSVT